MKPKAAFAFLVTVCLPLLAASQNATSQGVWKVDLRQGAIEAPMTKAEDGTRYYGFKNIPFAEPPVGDRRFKNPAAAGPWTGVRNGSVSSAVCPQLDSEAFSEGMVKVMGSEDCLYLEVYVPKKNASEFPVMVWIHEGGFLVGGAYYDPTPLMKEDVIVVVIQYRLGALGFLSTGDAVMSGNYGLKDQVMALQWVKENIKAFGGDPNKVTIFGSSSGGASVHLLMLSPMAKGLFHRAIAQSGTALFPGLLRDDHRQTAGKVGQMLNCSNVNTVNLDSKGLYDCLKNVSAEHFVKVASNFTRFYIYPQVMAPRVDGDFLPEHPAHMLKKGNYNKVNFMTGFNRDEGSLVIRPLLMNKSDSDELASNFSMHGPVLMSIQEGRRTSAEYMARRIFAHYVGGFNITEDTADDAVQMITDHWFAVPMDVSAMMHTKQVTSAHKVYLYELHHCAENNDSESLNATVGMNWVGHGDETQYLFNGTHPTPLTNPIDNFMREVMVSLWTNFARTGNPTPDMSLGFKWSPVRGSDLQYLVLVPTPYMKNSTRYEDVEFLTNLPTMQNEILFPERFVIEQN
ncbi:cholinesterase 1-like [Macrobrachium nipponense]|uniref:cholinesterase 1-like n=1 Tax=Macrobrachium nipponense TaxID=159736 RepID=UPI0030C809E1